MSVNPGELYHTTRGIAEIQSFYAENGIKKVRFWLHTVSSDDGVTATGEVVLMSTTPDKLQAWIDRFPVDMAERKKAVTAVKDFHPAEREKVDAILTRINDAQKQGPVVDYKRIKS